jgi:hypothetical protein
MHAHRLVLVALLVALAGCAAVPATPSTRTDGSTAVTWDVGDGTEGTVVITATAIRRRLHGAPDAELPGALSATRRERLAMACGIRHDPAALAARLRARRFALGLTRARVAELAGVAGPTYRRDEEPGQRPHDPARRAAIA